MTAKRATKLTLILAMCTVLIACGGNRAAQNTSASNIIGPVTVGTDPASLDQMNRENAGFNYTSSSIWDVFGPNQTEQTVNVNRYLWAASLDVLNFLPVQSVDPFTGIIVTGYGRPPGGGRSYRATVHIRDPALDARSLNVSLQGQNGAVNAATTRAVEDAILSRARQLRIRDRRL